MKLLGCSLVWFGTAEVGRTSVETGLDKKCKMLLLYVPVNVLALVTSKESQTGDMNAAWKDFVAVNLI